MTPSAGGFTFSGEFRRQAAILWLDHMKLMRCPNLPLTLAAGLSIACLAAPAQTPRVPSGQAPERSAARPGNVPRAPTGAAPEAGAVLPESVAQGAYGQGEERDAERVFAWMGPFEPMFTPAQLHSFRLNLKERLGEMRLLENRRRLLLREVLQLSVAADAKPEKLREKATALGQAVTELAMQQAEILRGIQPPPSAQQRGELRAALGQMLADGYEPFSFAQPEPTPADHRERSLPDLLGYPAAPVTGPGSGVPQQPRQAGNPPRPPTAPTAPPNR